MTELEQMYSLLEKTVDVLKDNKVHMLDIITNLKKDYTSKLEELRQIKDRLPQLIEKNNTLETQDKKMRLLLAHASDHMDTLGEAKLKKVYESTAKVHSDRLYFMEQEKFLRSRRNLLEIELKQSLHTIRSAETMAQQLCVALVYLEKDLLKTIKSPLETDENITLATQVLESLEHEKARISRELHDGPAQYLASVLMRIDFCKNIIQKDLAHGLRELDSLKSSIQHSLREVREILFDLTPGPLETSGLEQSLILLVHTLFEESSQKIHLSLNLPQVPLCLTLQTTIYRTVQEIFNNIKKHALAQTIHFVIEHTTTTIRLTISDDGKGFDVDHFLSLPPHHIKSYGIMSIVSRTKQLHGEIKIKSATNLGTRYLITLPIDLTVGGTAHA